LKCKTGKLERFKLLFLVTFSAIFFHVALWCPVYFFWFSFLYLIPIFYGALTFQERVSFKAGFLWGFIFSALHLHSITVLIINECSGLLRFVFPFLLLCYYALHTGVWFWLANKTGELLKNKKRAIAWIFWTWLLIIWMPSGFLWASGEYIGYPLTFPLLPLAQYPKLLFGLKFVCPELLVLCLICFSMGVTLFFTKKEKKYLFCAGLFLIPFLSGLLFKKKETEIPYFFKTFGYVQPPKVKENAPPLDVAQEIYYRINKLLKKHPEIRYIVMPELSCRFSLNNKLELIDLWTVNALHDNVALLIGACRTENKKTYNSFYFIKKGRVQEVHDKTRLMPFAEYIPTLYKNFKCCKNLFLSCNFGFCVGKQRKRFYFCDDFSCVNSICAEAILSENDLAINKSDNAVLLSIFNDSLFASSLAHLILLWVKLEGFKQNKFSLFVGYSFAILITPNGDTLKFLTMSN